jgi:hypothetical protein
MVTEQLHCCLLYPDKAPAQVGEARQAERGLQFSSCCLDVFL